MLGTPKPVALDTAVLSIEGLEPSRKLLNILGLSPPRTACSGVRPQLSHTVSGVARLAVWLLLLGVVAVAMAHEFRSRIALALTVAVVMALAHASGALYRWPRGRVWSYLGRISYAVFLMNFPVALVVNAAFTRFAPADVALQTGGVLLAWAWAVLAGAAFFHFVEEPLRRWVQAPASGWSLRLATLLGFKSR